MAGETFEVSAQLFNSSVSSSIVSWNGETEKFLSESKNLLRLTPAISAAFD